MVQTTPLWKQFYNKQKLEAQKQSVSENKNEEDLQGFYQYLAAQRKGIIISFQGFLFLVYKFVMLQNKAFLLFLECSQDL